MHVSPEIGERRSLPPKDDVALTRSQCWKLVSPAPVVHPVKLRVLVVSQFPPPTFLAHYDIRAGWLETRSAGTYEL